MTTEATITLGQFDTIDGLLQDLLRAGDFETCADPRGYIRTENRLYDALVEALGRPFVDDFASALECAALVVARCLLGLIDVTDEEDA